MYCGGCLRDNALVGALRKLGHSTLMVPLYLPMTLDEEDQGREMPIFYGGISVYLEQKIPLFRKVPDWLRHWLARPSLLWWASGRAAKTRPDQVGDLAISMLQGENGHQARELEDLIAWLKTSEHPDIICLSNGLLVGMARRLKAALGVPVVCTLQGEDYFLDGLPPAERATAWRLTAARAADVDLFIAPSRYYAERMAERLNLPADRVRAIHNGINLQGYEDPDPARTNVMLPVHPVLGFLGRMCREKGLDLLVEAFIKIRQRSRVPFLKLSVGGGLGPADVPFVESLKARLRACDLLSDTEFHPNLSHVEKIGFLRSLSVFSAPALYGEAFGLYVIEALAAGVPVVQPRHAAFPELVEATGGGLICDPTAEALADAIESLVLDPNRAHTLGEAGREAVRHRFTVERMAREIAAAYEAVRDH